MRYYYDCRIKAEFMGVYHGIKFICRFTCEDGEYEEYPMMQEWFSNHFNCSKGKHIYYIHPASLPILEPQEGDAFTDTSNPAGEIILEDRGQYGGHCQYSGKMTIANAKKRIGQSLCKIIQRKNQPFIWPEQEG